MDLFAQQDVVKTDTQEIIDGARFIFSQLSDLDVHARIYAINELRTMLHQYSPFMNEPVDCVQWVSSDDVVANGYNPNSVAPPEMKLLEHSITEDGYTQPIVAWKTENGFEVIDGFHRNRVGKESEVVRRRVMGYLPLTIVNDARLDKGDRIAATIRHNRARGKHKVEAMSDIVMELKRRNWTDEKIGRELGMDADEVLRLCQITGLAEAFKDQQFSEAWTVDRADAMQIGDEVLSDVISDFTPNDKGRILHTWEKWECYRHGFYEEHPKDMTQEEGEERYREFLSDLGQFEAALRSVTQNWKHSCEHYLTNDRMNRTAWLGQASVACALGIPSCCRGGYHRLTDSQKESADQLALEYLNKWLQGNGRPEVSLKEASGRTEMELY